MHYRTSPLVIRSSRGIHVTSIDAQRPLVGVLDALEDAGNSEQISVGDVLAAFQHRTLGVLLILLGVITSLPVVGAIPGMSILTGTLILVAIGQNLVGGGSLWVPGFVRKRKFSRDKLMTGIKKARPWLQKADGILTQRLTILSTGSVTQTAISIATAILAAAFYATALIPFGVTVPAIGVVCFGIGMTARDGLFVLVGYSLSLGTAYMVFTLL